MALEDIEQLVPLKVAAELIPMPSLAALRVFLSRHEDEFPPKYRNTHLHRVGTFPLRMLTESEILKIREMTINAKPGRYAGGRPLGSVTGKAKIPSGPLAHVFRKLEAQRA